MCLVELDSAEKLVIACLTTVESNFNILTDTIAVKKARENVLETLLLNHPLDCPICDQAGECDLQDQTKIFGNYLNKMYSKKRGVEDKYCGSLIKTIMTRCIHCTRCVRFGSEIVGVDIFGTLNRGNMTEIGAYTETIFDSNISGNVIDLCPVGALTSKPYAFKTRPWELRSTESIDLTDSLGSQILVNYKESSILRILPKTNTYLNGNLISDTTRFSYDALENNRVYNVYSANSNNLELLSWKKFLNIFNNLKSKKITLLVNEQLDLKTINTLKFLMTLYNNIKVRSHSRFNEFTNFYNFINLSKNTFIEEKNNLCILLGSNLKTENAILNTKIRLQSLENNYKLYSLGNKYKSKSTMSFINLHMEDTLSFFEGKSKELSKTLLTSYCPKIIFGEGFKKRFYSLNTFKEKFLKFNFTIKTLVINSSANTEGNFFFGIKSLNLKDINMSDSLFFLNINDNILIRKIIYNYKNLVFLFNTHFFSFLRKNLIIVPTASKFFETSGIYINMLQNIQKTSKIFNPVNNLKDINFFITKLFNLPKNNFKYLNFILETINTSNLYFLKNKTILTYLTLVNKFKNNTFHKVSLHPLKFYLQNLNKTDTFIKNSYFMNSYLLHKK